MDSEKLDKAIKELDESSSAIKGFSEIFGELSRMQNSISENNDFFKSVSSKLRIIAAALDDELKSFKAIFKELDSALISRLEKHKSDIQVEIRDEGKQIQRGFENSLMNNFNNLESRLNDKFKNFETQLKGIKNWIIISLIFGFLNFSLFIYFIFK